MSRIAEFDIAKSFALIALVISHSNFYRLYPEITEVLRNYLLTVFFFAAGYFAYRSLKNKSFKQFWKEKIVNIYIPFLIILVLIYFSGRYITVQPEAYLYHATGVNLFHNYQLTTLNLQHLWFVPQLLLYFLLTSILQKKVDSLSFTTFIWSVFFAVNLLLWGFQSDFRFMRRMYVYIIPFVLGYIISNYNMLDRVLKNNKLIAFFTVSAIATFAFDPVRFSNESFILTNTLHHNLLGVSLFLLSLRFFGYLKNKVFVNLTRNISRAGLFIYLIHTVPMMWFSQKIIDSEEWYATGLLDTNQTIYMLILCIPFVIALGYLGYQGFCHLSKKIVPKIEKK